MENNELNRYDRQIRAWGFETQNKLKACKFLFYGITNSSLECMKNLILAGASFVHVLDSSNTEMAFANYVEFLKTLNPYCPLTVIHDDNFNNFQNYDYVCLFNANMEIFSKVIQTECVCLMACGLTAYLLYGVPSISLHFNDEPTDVIDETISGSLFSQLIIDHLPPIPRTALQLKFDANNMSTSVQNVCV
ncbi:SUMO-activating enzyme subunit 1 [Histomonas meleagridis]|uniref:SUMO-activating enzyme subunit 1 n=1 Tax=Histomonas meleagridis TaxID=135588 RepID=UPI00355A2115|nr:SUMO-activating enzyme subunit 1 [Histomonas meleagridis]KAH0798898.1 SUMO-activating enzyme subunit 1 [Histomonas meleagridis]